MFSERFFFCRIKKRIDQTYCVIIEIEIKRLKKNTKCECIPEINSFGIDFLPDVVTRYSIKFSIRSTTHAVINLLKLSKICFVEAACAALGLFIFVKLSLDVICCGDDRSNGG